MAEAASILSERDSTLRHIVVRSPGVDAALFDEVFACHSPLGARPCPLEVAPADKIHDILAASDVVVTKAGTVTLEAALHRCPMVVLYRGSFLQEVEYRLLHARRIRFIAMPNILMGRVICHELIQHAATPERVAEHAWELLSNSALRERAIRDLAAVAELLGPPGASERAARLALSMIRTGVARGE